jgi:hypothetical protein
MTYTKRHFADELLAEIENGYDASRIAKWCYTRFLDERELEDGLAEVMDEVYGMDAGPEFEMSEAELRELAASLKGSTGS